MAGHVSTPDDAPQMRAHVAPRTVLGSHAGRRRVGRPVMASSGEQGAKKLWCAAASLCTPPAASALTAAAP